MKTKVLSLLYFIAGILFILLENHSSVVTQFVLKALIIPWLIIIFAISLKPFNNRFNTLMFFGLICSWAGDMTLQFYFIPGLIFFLLTHIMYLTVFFMTPGRSMIFTRRLYLLIPVILYGAGICYFLYDDLGEMKFPVIIYTLVILTMLAGAINRKEKVNTISYWLVLAGAILFVLSDSALAIHKFSLNFNYSGIVIMSTYLAAQYLITIGFITQHPLNTNS
jgi:uncharacterized membrane protein YhhN